KPEWGAENGYMQFAIWARMVSQAGSFYPPDVIKEYEKGETFPSMVGDVHFRAEDHQLVRPVVMVRGKAPKDMQNKEDFWEVLEVVPGEPLMQKPDAFGCSSAATPEPQRPSPRPKRGALSHPGAAAHA